MISEAIEKIESLKYQSVNELLSIDTDYLINLHKILLKKIPNYRYDSSYAISKTTTGWIFCTKYGHHKEYEKLHTERLRIKELNNLTNFLNLMNYRFPNNLGRVFIEEDGSLTWRTREGIPKIIL
jgi:hypothetical protein